MHPRHLVIVFGVLAAPLSAIAQPAPGFQAPIIANDGKEIGTLSLRGGPRATVLRIEIRRGGLTPGWHGLHFHAVGDCSDHEKFMNAKAHVNHSKAPHGLLNPQGTEEGDLPNLWVSEDESAKTEITSQTVTLDHGAHALRDADGSAFIIHAGEDDHLSQPIGNSGARLACALIR